MKISNYMNNTNSIMEKNTDKVQKGNSQTNEKHTVGQSVKLSISNEGLEYYRNRIQQSGQEKYDDVVQRKELLASKKISDIDYSYEIQKKAAQQNQNVDTGKSALNITDKANNYVKAYAELYDEIVNKNLLIRRINIAANHVINEKDVVKKDDYEQLDLFTDYEEQAKKKETEEKQLQREKQMQKAMLEIKKKYGKNAILKGTNLTEGATTIERNEMIGGHKA